MITVLYDRKTSKCARTTITKKMCACVYVCACMQQKKKSVTRMLCCRTAIAILLQREKNRLHPRKKKRNTHQFRDFSCGSLTFSFPIPLLSLSLSHQTKSPPQRTLSRPAIRIDDSKTKIVVPSYSPFRR